MASSAMTLSVVATGKSSLAGVHVGTSGWSYPSWKPDFYPAGTDSKEFLSFYAQRFSTVELNTTGYRLPAEEQFRRWAEQTLPGFRFAPKLAGKIHVYMGGEDTFYLEGATALLKESLTKLGSDAAVEIFPGKDHGTLMTRQLRERIAREMAESYKRCVPSPRKE